MTTDHTAEPKPVNPIVAAAAAGRRSKRPRRIHKDLYASCDGQLTLFDPATTRNDR
ncbi:hypothetical protein AB0B25_05405 [Nocardia sp. NPDC049190]|uniref:hypothetical protein n=1 Tax=Nocardia sp. NPDC049190 TaxID=3155650 RepID=UPI003407D8B2